MAAVERKGAYFLLGNALQLESKKTSTFTRWWRNLEQPEQLLLPVHELQDCKNAALCRVEKSSQKLTVSLMLG